MDAVIVLIRVSINHSLVKLKHRFNVKVLERISVAVYVKSPNAKKNTVNVLMLAFHVPRHVNVKIAQIIFSLLQKVTKTERKNSSLE